MNTASLVPLAVATSPVFEVDTGSFLAIVATAAIAATVSGVAGGRNVFIPVVVVELVLGVVIGPQVLDLAQVSDFTDFFASLGLGMLFFFAGYEIDMGRIAGQRDIDAVGDQARVELGGLKLRRAIGDRRLEVAAGQVGRLADRAALLGRQLGDAAQDLRQLGLAAQVLHAYLLERVAGGRLRDGLVGLGGDLVDAVVHGSRLSSYSAIVAAMAAFRDSEAIGMWATRSHPATTSAGSPSRSAPTTTVMSVAAVARRGSPARATSAIVSPGSSATDSTRATGTSNRAPIEARTALGP